MAVVPGAAEIRLGLRVNLARCALLVGVNALVCGMSGKETRGHVEHEQGHGQRVALSWRDVFAAAPVGPS